MEKYSLLLFMGFLSLLVSNMPSKELKKDDSNSTSFSLEAVSVEADSFKDYISSPSKIVKDIDELKKQQVLNIRDLIRYDAGISVVEQNRGGSAGYAIRGVDRNRVAITVDGIEQTQSYVMQGANGGGGSINEVENQNIKKVEINKGGSSSEFGSGALGGVVAFYTKDVDDVLDNDEKMGGEFKSAYSSKNRQKTNSLTLAARAGGFEVLTILTYKNGREITPHKSVGKDKQKISRIGAYLNKYDLRAEQNKLSTSYFIIRGECADYVRSDRSIMRSIRKMNRKIKLTMQKRDAIPWTPGVENLEKIKLTKRLDRFFAQRTQIANSLAATSQIANCPAVRPMAKPTYSNDSYVVSTNPIEHKDKGYENVSFSQEELDQLEKMKDPVEWVSAKEYTGAQRVLPDPMKYQSKSLLLKLGYRFNPEHKIQAVVEHTIQDYNTRDMSVPSYYESDMRTTIQKRSTGIYRLNGSILDNIYIMEGPFKWGDDNSSIKNYRFIGIKWAKAIFYDEKHTKNRLGASYLYTPENNNITDKIVLSYDHQNIQLNLLTSRLNCSEYPNIDKNCKASIDKPGSFDASESIKYNENYGLFKIKFDKEITLLKDISSDIQIQLGSKIGKSLLRYGDYKENYIYQNWDSKNLFDSSFGIVNGTKQNPFIYFEKEKTELESVDLCKNTSAFRDCNDRVINGKNYFISLKNFTEISKYLSLDLGLRYDINNFNTKDSWSSVKNYRNGSWSLAFRFQPTQMFGLIWRSSTAFRVPSYQEMFGFRIPGFVKGEDDEIHFKSNLSPEKAFNQEFGIDITNQGWEFMASYFFDDYKGLISIAQGKRKDPADKRTTLGYYNAHNVSLSGIDLQGRIYPSEFMKSLPMGLYFVLAYSHIKPKTIKNTQEFEFTNSNLLEAIQPARYVFGVGYDSIKWGVSAMLIHSKAKNPKEVRAINQNNELIETNTRTSQPWTTVDVITYVNIKKNINVNLGVYNIFNHKYTTWESLRQSSLSAINRRSGLRSHNLFVAPGRNFVISFDMKF